MCTALGVTCAKGENNQGLQIRRRDTLRWLEAAFLETNLGMVCLVAVGCNRHGCILVRADVQ